MMEALNEKKWVRNTTLLGTHIDDELVMMDGERGLYFSLNPVGTQIWQLLETPKTSQELIQSLCHLYEITEAECQQDVSVFLEKMEEAKLINLSAVSSAE